MNRKSARRPLKTRARKPIPARHGPVRDWAGMVGGNQPAARPRPPKRERGSNPGDRRNPVNQGVNLGYRVIQDYLRQGERFARSFWSPGDDEPSRNEPARLFDQALRSAQDLAGTFSQLIRVLASNTEAAGAEPGDPRGGAGPFDVSGAGRSSPGPRGPRESAPAASEKTAQAGAVGPLVLEVESRRTVKVSLSPSSPGLVGPLQVPPLTHLRRREAVLEQVSAVVRGSDRRLVIRVRVPPALPSGTYRGAILQAKTGAKVGAIEIQVGR